MSVVSCQWSVVRDRSRAPGGIAPSQPAMDNGRRTRLRGFTLVEMLVVMGIIILVILIAIPAIQSITGVRSVGAAQNTLAALLTRAREEAVGLQEIRGVLFYLDPATDGVQAAIVRQVPPPIPDPNSNPPVVYLDAVPNRDYLPLPKGIGVQTLINAALNGNSQYSSDAYLGFNPITVNGTTATCKVGGVILFDGNGKLVSKTYGLKFNTNGAAPTPLASLLGMSGIQNDYAMTAPTNYPPPSAATPVRMASQIGLVLYDRQTFLSQSDSGGANFTDGDPGLDPGVSGYGGYGYPSSTGNAGTGEGSEEGWLDKNATPILINRYNGTMIRAE